jgi:hypothetical protein
MAKKSNRGLTADEIADKATRGEDVSGYFTGIFRAVRPVKRVNIDFSVGMLRELDSRAARLNVSRQAVITTLACAGTDGVGKTSTAFIAHRIYIPPFTSITLPVM